MENILPQRRAFFGQIRVGFFLRLQVNRGAVVRGTDRAREKRSVVARIVPCEAPFVATILPKAHRELYGFDRLLAVERDGLAVGLDLLAAPRPQVRVPEAGRVAERVAEGLAKGMTRGFELLAGLAVFLPGFRKFSFGVADLIKPRRAIGQQPAPDRPGDPDPLAVDIIDELGDIVVTTLRLADLLSDISDIGDAGFVEPRPIIDDHDHVGTIARLDRGGDPRLNVVGVDHLDIELDAECLFAFGDDFIPQHLI